MILSSRVSAVPQGCLNICTVLIGNLSTSKLPIESLNSNAHLGDGEAFVRGLIVAYKNDVLKFHRDTAEHFEQLHSCWQDSIDIMSVNHTWHGAVHELHVAHGGGALRPGTG